MAQLLSFDEVMGKSADPATTFRNDPLIRESQAGEQQRLADAKRIREAELKPDGGGLLPNTLTASSLSSSKEPQLLSLADVGVSFPSEPPATHSTWSAVVGNFKQLVGNTAALGDMVLSLPAQMVGLGADMGVRAYAAGAGVDRRTAGQAAELARGIAEPISNPLQKLMKAAGYGEDYDSSDIASAFKTLGTWIDKGGEWIEKKTKGVLLKEDVASLVNTVMASGGVTGVKTAADFISRKPGMDAKRNQAGINPNEKPPGPGPEPGPRPGTPNYTADIRRAAGIEKGATYEGEWSRVQDEVNQIAGKAPEARTPVETSKLVSFNSAWAKENALSLAAATALAAYTLYGEDKEKGAIGLAVIGAMKGKGGMWHPKAAETLAQPIIGRTVGLREVFNDPVAAEQMLQNSPDLFKAAKEEAWAFKAAQNYLNRHMGTETDPLKDIEIPFGEGTKKWGEVTSALVNSHPFKELTVGSAVNMPIEQVMRMLKEKPDEPVWNLDVYSPPREGLPEASSAAQALKSYLSHVGDYLRQNVPPEKLPQYDLPRAVKETAASDERAAREMEKAAVSSMKDLPVHKEYPDGFRWVILKVPEKLTPEQARTVRKATPEETKAYIDQVAPERQGGEYYIALDASGKPILSSWTKNPAFADTPEHAYAAGQLMQEGRAMGHSVGGYGEFGGYGAGGIDAIIRGDAKIYSLRDPKGLSHVTVEVEKPDTHLYPPSKFYDEPVTLDMEDYWYHHSKPVEKGEFGNSAYKNELLQWEEEVRGTPEYQEWLAKQTPDIRQIKGKQNKAPNKEYLPYVQDFVKGGEWGEVGDLENTGLSDVSSMDQDLRRRLEEKGLLKDRYISATDFDDLLKQLHGVPKGERGSIDPKVLAGLAALGIGATAGALLDPNHPFHGAILGLLAGAVATRLTPANAMKVYRKATAPSNLIKLDHLSKSAQHAKLQIARAAWQVENRIIDLVPSLKRREAITRVFESGKLETLNPKEQTAARELYQAWSNVSQAGLEGSSLQDMIEIYVRHLFPGKSASGQNAMEWLRSRSGPTLTRIPKMAEMKAAGFRPITEDAAQIYGIYANAVGRALENKKYIAAVKASTGGPQNIPLAVPVGRGGFQDYISLSHPQMRGWKVHPDIAPDLNFMFDQNDAGAIMRALDAVSTTQKRIGVAFSLFHAKSLLDAAIGASKVARMPVRIGRAVGQSIAPSVFGRNKFLEQLRTGGAGDLVDRAQKAGVNFTLERQTPSVEEQGAGFYPVLRSIENLLDNTVPGAGKLVKGVEYLNHQFDSFMWGRLHAGLKLELFAEKAAELTKNNAAAASRNPNGKFKTQDEIDEAAASFTNDIFGGLNWLRLAQEPQSRVGRMLASGALSPSGRQVMRIMMFAPDWTISTTRAFVKAFGKGSGLKGLLKPQELADLHRQYVLRSLVFFFVIADALNYHFSGHHLWSDEQRNKDWTRVDLGDGRTMQLSKHSMEPFHWLQHPGQQALNKLGFVPKETLNQALHTEYLSSLGKGSPPMKGSRLGHALRQFAPISGQGDDATAAVSGFLGAPIYGKKKQ